MWISWINIDKVTFSTETVTPNIVSLLDRNTFSVVTDQTIQVLIELFTVFSVPTLDSSELDGWIIVNRIMDSAVPFLIFTANLRIAYLVLSHALHVSWIVIL